MDPQNQQQPNQPTNPTPEQPVVEQPQWQYQSGQLEQNTGYQQELQAQPTEAISWSASEFVSHEKNKSWYLLLIIYLFVLSGIVFAVTRQILSVLVVFVLGAAVGVFGSLKPRELNYAVNTTGVSVGDKHYDFNSLKSFILYQDSAIPSVQLMPQKRLMMPITLYLPPENAGRIIEFLGEFLPVEQKQPDFVDRLTHKFHF
jgi:hypothetical protein